jgi:hypothetical protein
MKLITISDGTTVKVDDEDFEWLSKKKWSASGDGYAMRMEKDDSGVYRNIKMHRLIIGAKKGQIVDHINQDRSDNRRGNLRITSRAINAINSKLRKSNTSGYRGVYMQDGKWKAQISFDNEQKHLGYYSTKEEAALAYNVSALEYYGEDAVLNEVEEVV